AEPAQEFRDRDAVERGVEPAVEAPHAGERNRVQPHEAHQGAPVLTSVAVDDEVVPGDQVGDEVAHGPLRAQRRRRPLRRREWLEQGADGPPLLEHQRAVLGRCRQPAALPYSASVTWSPHDASPSVIDRCAMKCAAAAPCQCHSSAGVYTTSPARMVTADSPRDCTRPSPSMTYSVWP